MIKGEKNNIDLSFEDMQFLLALYETQSLTQTAGQRLSNSQVMTPAFS